MTCPARRRTTHAAADKPARAPRGPRHPFGTTALLLAAAALAGCGAPPPAGWAGYVEGEYVYVAAPLAGALAQLPAAAGRQVAAGEALFALDDEAERAAAAEAGARRDSARAQARNTDSGRRADELAVTEAQLAQARTQAALARSELARQQALLAQGFVSAARLDDAGAAAAQGAARVAELEAALRAARLPARPEERLAARAGAEAADEALKQSRWRLAQKRQAAPVAGLVADTYFRVGEWVPAGAPVLSLLPPGGVKLRFYVAETEVAGLRAGQALAVRCDGCGATIAAAISRIAPQAEYTPPVIYSNAQRARLVFLVEARPLQAGDAARLRPGQPVEVRRAGAA